MPHCQESRQQLRADKHLNWRESQENDEQNAATLVAGRSDYPDGYPLGVPTSTQSKVRETAFCHPA
jgi:hypothetical protein